MARSSHRSVLMLDDENHILEPLQMTLKNKEFDVTPSYEVDRAYHSIKSSFENKTENFDVILLDIRLPSGKEIRDKETYGRKTGVVFVEKLKEIHPDFLKRIIVFTGVTDLSTLKALQDLGIKRIYSKLDINQLDLVDKIEQLLVDLDTE